MREHHGLDRAPIRALMLKLCPGESAMFDIPGFQPAQRDHYRTISGIALRAFGKGGYTIARQRGENRVVVTRLPCNAEDRDACDGHFEKTSSGWRGKPAPTREEAVAARRQREGGDA